MKNIIIILALFISTSAFPQVKSGDTENGEGQYQYSNGATYTGEWKDGKRHGKGVMIYPKGANEANTVKTTQIDTTCICSNWAPDALPSTEEKIWEDIGMKTFDLLLSESELKKIGPGELFYKFNGEAGGKTVFNPANFKTAYEIVDLIIKEDYKNATVKVSEWALGNYFPAVVAYKSLIEASILTINMIIENWEQDLYLMPIYQKVDELMVKEIQKGDRDFNAYLFSGYIRKNPALRKKMQERENRMYYEWEKVYGNDMYISMSSLWGENSFARIVSEFKKKYPEGTVITNKMIFTHFMWMSAYDHKDEMNKIFQTEMEVRAEEEASKMKRSMIKAVCESQKKKK